MRRRLFTLAIFLLLGAVTTVAVAWWLSITITSVRPSSRSWRNVHGYYRWLEQGDLWAISLSTRGGTLYMISAQVKTPIRPIGKDALLPDELIPRWSRFSGPFDDQEQSIQPLWHEYGHGWPVLAMSHRRETTLVAGKGVPTLFDSFQLPHWLASTGQITVVPLRVIWRGFAVDSLLYGAIWFALLFAPAMIRRFLRRRRGACPLCGYDLRHADHAACPECGAAA